MTQQINGQFIDLPVRERFGNPCARKSVRQSCLKVHDLLTDKTARIHFSV